MPSNFGTFIEEELAMAINNKRVCDMQTNVRYTLFRIFGPLEENEVFHAERLGDHSKPDIWVEYKGIRKYISVKSGRATEVHQEQLKTFIPFLEESGLSKESVQFFKEYCYGDGTDDGTGTYVEDFPRMKIHFEKRTAAFNAEVIKNTNFILAVLNRCLFTGALNGAPTADYVYFGTKEYGEIMSMSQIKKQLEHKNWGFMTNPHIGPLQFRMKIRGQAKCKEKEYLRHCVQIWWANLQTDVQSISKRFNLN